MTLATLGAKFGLKKGRVKQILDDGGIYTTHRNATHRNAARNQKLLQAWENRPTITLAALGAAFGITGARVQQILTYSGNYTRRWHRKHMPIQCPGCYRNFRPRDAKRKHCSRMCRTLAGRVTLTCAWCGKAFSRRRKLHLLRPSRDGPFCSHQCSGHVMGKRYGWGWNREGAP